jgi:hypothetical protein
LDAALAFGGQPNEYLVLSHLLLVLLVPTGQGCSGDLFADSFYTLSLILAPFVFPFAGQFLSSTQHLLLHFDYSLQLLIKLSIGQQVFQGGVLLSQFGHVLGKRFSELMVCDLDINIRVKKSDERGIREKGGSCGPGFSGIPRLFG